MSVYEAMTRSIENIEDLATEVGGNDTFASIHHGQMMAREYLTLEAAQCETL